LNLTKITANVTAADSYAKQQVWEMSFTLPETVNDEAELTLLNFEGKSVKDKDGGFKIAGGKVYYTEAVETDGEKANEYKEMAKVTLTPGATYKAQRIVNFTNEEAFTSSYYLYDTEGKCVGKAENIPMLSVTLPVQKIGFAVKGFGENTVYFDDFKLYSTGFASDLFLYEAEFGMPNEDLTAAYSGKTGYRYSWMNASDKEEKVQIVAQTLDAEGKVVTEKVIKELTMAPGYDGVEMGIYDAGEEAVVFAVKTVVEKGPDMQILLIAALAVVLIAACAAAVIIVKKKKPQTPAAE
jgi:hypothetical protein